MHFIKKVFLSIFVAAHCIALPAKTVLFINQMKVHYPFSGIGVWCDEKKIADFTYSTRVSINKSLQGGNFRFEFVVDARKIEDFEIFQNTPLEDVSDDAIYILTRDCGLLKFSAKELGVSPDARNFGTILEKALEKDMMWKI